jgi:hypothetical protein
VQVQVQVQEVQRGGAGAKMQIVQVQMCRGTEVLRCPPGAEVQIWRC